MVANISPSIICIEDTLYTLQYANRAKNIKISLTKNIFESNYHISKYDDRIKELKLQISEVKQELMEKEKSQIPNYLSPEEQSKDSQYDIIQTKIVNHFQEEIKVRKEIIEKERQIEKIKNEISENEYKLTQFDQEGKKNITQLLKAQKTENEKLKAEMVNDYTFQSNLMKRRKDLHNLINKINKENSSNSLQGATNISPSMILNKNLGYTYKYYIALIENITSEQRKFVNLNELKRKDNQIMQLAEQLDYRDQFIYTAGKEIQRADINFNFKNNNILSADEIDMNPYRLPVIKFQSEPIIENNKKAISQPAHQLKNIKEMVVSPPKMITSRRQYNYDLLPLINNTIGTDYLSKFQRRNVPSPLIRMSYDTIPTNEQGLNNNKLLVPNMVLYRNSPMRNKLNQSPSARRYGYSPTRQTYHYRHQSMSTKNKQEEKSIDKSYETNTSQLENEIQQKVKTILKKDIIGRYKRSPYIKKEFNL